MVERRDDMEKMLFDASALLDLVRMLGSDSLDYLRGNYILDLTIYEVGNAVWKEAVLLNKISLNEALELLRSINKVYEVLVITTSKDPVLTLNIAGRLRITFYDASYISAAYENNADLVTDDEKLIKRINENQQILSRILGREITVYTTKELIRRPR